jgi:hypothetical protein
LAKILQSQCKFEDETKRLLERCLAICIRNKGPDGANTAISNVTFGTYYYELAIVQPIVDTRRKHYLISISHIEEGFRIQTKIHGPPYPNTVQAASLLSAFRRELSKL